MSDKSKILIVEDETEILEMWKIQLELEGFLVAEANDGDSGFLVAKKFIPDLILLDIIMPKTNGYDMLRRLKSDSDTKHISVVIFSNLCSEQEIEKGLQLGAMDFIVKSSITPVKMVQKVKTFIHQHTPF